MQGELSASDVALVTRNNGNYGGYGDCYGGGGFMWIFALLLLFWGGNNGFNRQGNAVTEADLCNANSFNELKGSVGRLNDQVNGVNVNLGNAICNLGYTNLENFKGVEKQIGETSCATQKQIDQWGYNISQQLAATNANTNAAMQKILDTMYEEKAARQAARIQQLELQQALCGVVRYPTSMAYSAGFSPFCQPQCGNPCQC